MEKNSSSFRLDERVFLTMITVIILSILLFAYRYKNNKPCELLNLSIDSTGSYVGIPLSFKAEGSQGLYTWDFNDGSALKQGDYLTTHIFKQKGVYEISVKLNGDCRKTLKIEIRDRPVVQTSDIFPKFICPSSVPINTLISFIDSTNKAVKQEWFFEQDEQVNRTGKKVNWTFTSAGLKTITLRINDDPNLICKKIIEVKEPPEKKEKPFKPERPVNRDDRDLNKHTTIPPLVVIDSNKIEIPKVEVEAAGPGVSAADVKTFLFDVADSKKSATDFSRYLRKKNQPSVMYNGENMTFDSMCKQIEKLKKRQIRAIDVEVVAENGYVIKLTVTLTKRFLGII